MPHATPITEVEKLKSESTLSSAAPSPSPSVASSKDERIRGSKSTGPAASSDLKEKDGAATESSSIEDSPIGDGVEPEKKPACKAEVEKMEVDGGDVKEKEKEKVEADEKVVTKTETSASDQPATPEKDVKRESDEAADAKTDTAG